MKPNQTRRNKCNLASQTCDFSCSSGTLFLKRMVSVRNLKSADGSMFEEENPTNITFNPKSIPVTHFIYERKKQRILEYGVSFLLWCK